METNASKPRSGNGLAITGMIFGLLSLPSFFIPLFGWIVGVLLGSVALILSLAAIMKAGKSGAPKTSGVIALLLSVLAGVMAGILYVQAQKSNEEDLKKLEDTVAVDTLSKVIDKLEFLTDSAASSRPDSSKSN